MTNLNKNNNKMDVIEWFGRVSPGHSGGTKCWRSGGNPISNYHTIYNKSKTKGEKNKTKAQISLWTIKTNRLFLLISASRVFPIKNKIVVFQLYNNNNKFIACFKYQSVAKRSSNVCHVLFELSIQYNTNQKWKPQNLFFLESFSSCKKDEHYKLYLVLAINKIPYK